MTIARSIASLVAKPIAKPVASVGASGSAIVYKNVATIYDGLSFGTSSALTQATYGVRVRIFGASSGRSINLVYGNFRQIPEASSSAIDIAAAVDDGSVRACTFSGAAEKACASGAIVQTDPITVTSASFFTIRTRPKLASGSWPLGIVYGAESFGGYNAGVDLTGTGSGALTSAVGYGFGPLAVIAPKDNSGRKSVLIRGDSITVGQADNGSGYTKEGFFDTGWAVRVINHTMPVVRWAKGSTFASDIVNDTFALPTLAYHDYFICAYGVNDLTTSTAAAIKTRLNSIWTTAKAAGLRVAQATITPRATYNTIRDEVNAYIRSKPSPLDYVIEVADAVETARDSGTWITGYTGDSIHPNDTGHTAIASAVGAGLLADIALA